ncbi:hypothetical protein PHYBOEH_005519 [Phytophthora boehmeriae]|uniref:Uncharacterized protein n=1 Tax=Phytophthora boehmeriae TaxID=109152 RepID=A0A8T1X4E3_9STRA|nr:hypothetical protein PHYBOEH_005519 [Phytophthora boehmeriae]
MDVPSWHPANQNADALRRLQTQGEGAPSKRAEFKVMAGSSVDMSTEAGRQLVDKEDSVVGGGRGLLDPSDRLYLLEQTQLEQAAKSREQLEREAALQSFRSTALKAQTLRSTTVLPELPTASTTGKTTLRSSEKKCPVIYVKAKRRRALRTEKEEATAKKIKTKRAETMFTSSAKSGGSDTVKQDSLKSGQNAETTNGGKCDGGSMAALPTEKSTLKTSVLLLQGYSSSSDDE